MLLWVLLHEEESKCLFRIVTTYNLLLADQLVDIEARVEGLRLVGDALIQVARIVVHVNFEFRFDKPAGSIQSDCSEADAKARIGMWLVCLTHLTREKDHVFDIFNAIVELEAFRLFVDSQLVSARLLAKHLVDLFLQALFIAKH